MKVPKATDRRVVRTRGTLRDALIALLQTRGWDDISVNDICTRANVGRSTFYTHFADKEELLVSGFADLKAALRNGVQQTAPSGTTLAFARGLLAHVADNQRIFRALMGKRSGEVVNRMFRLLVVELTQEELAARVSKSELEPATHYVAGAFVGLLSWWLDGRTGRPLDDLEARFQTLTAPVLRVAGRHARAAQ